MQIYISKIEGIPVIQDNQSTLSSSNKSSSRKDLKKGKNKQQDLGEGEKTLSTKFIIRDSSTFDKIYKVITKKRTVTLTDKFIGDMKAFIKSWNITNSDKHLNITYFSITFKIDETFNPKINYKGNILNHITKIDQNNKYSPIEITNNLMPDIQGISDNTFRVANNINTSELDKYFNENLVLTDNQLKKINFVDDYYNFDYFTKPFKLFDLTPINGILNAKINNLNLASIFFNNKFISFYLNKLLNAKNPYYLDNLKNVVVNFCDKNLNIIDVGLITEYTLFDYVQIIEDVINYATNSELGSLENTRFTKYTNIPHWVYNKYGNLDNVEELKEINKTYIDLHIGDFKYFSKAD